MKIKTILFTTFVMFLQDAGALIRCPLPEKAFQMLTNEAAKKLDEVPDIGQDAYDSELESYAAYGENFKGTAHRSKRPILNYLGDDGFRYRVYAHRNNTLNEAIKRMNDPYTDIKFIGYLENNYYEKKEKDVKTGIDVPGMHYFDECIYEGFSLHPDDPTIKERRIIDFSISDSNNPGELTGEPNKDKYINLGTYMRKAEKRKAEKKQPVEGKAPVAQPEPIVKPTPAVMEKTVEVNEPQRMAELKPLAQGQSIQTETYAWDTPRPGESTTNQGAREAAQKATLDAIDKYGKIAGPTLLENLKKVSEEWSKITGREVLRRAGYMNLLTKLQSINISK